MSFLQQTEPGGSFLCICGKKERTWCAARNRPVEPEEDGPLKVTITEEQSWNAYRSSNE